MSNLLESLIYGLPPDISSKILEVADKSDDMCTVNCESIDALGDYILELQEALKKVVNDSDCGFIAKSHIDKINTLL